MFTQTYSQPDYYHFSQSSVEAACWIAQIIKSNHFKSFKLIDLFSGCGIFSIELIHRLPMFKIKQWYLIESQLNYQQHLRLNTQDLLIKNPVLKIDMLYQDCLDWLIKNQQKILEEDIVLMNPPHFFTSEGKMPDSEEKKMCYFIEEEKWCLFLHQLLQVKCKIFILLRLDTQLYKKTLLVFKIKIKAIQLLTKSEAVIYIN